MSVIVHEIIKSFDSNPTLEVRGVFLDISKAFDRVWHEGLIYKLRCSGFGMRKIQACGNRTPCFPKHNSLDVRLDVRLDDSIEYSMNSRNNSVLRRVF